MNYLFIILLTVISAASYSQNSLDARIITYNNDTINSKIRIQRNTFNKKLINESSFFQNVTLVDEEGKKIASIDASEVKELRFTDLNGKNKVYVNDGNSLIELVYDGKKIKFYYEIRLNVYDGSTRLYERLVDEEGKRYTSEFIWGFKKVLLKVVKSKPDLVEEIKNTKKITRDEFIMFLERYDSEQ